jgi:hypothetical protein
MFLLEMGISLVHFGGGNQKNARTYILARHKLYGRREKERRVEEKERETMWMMFFFMVIMFVHETYMR